MLIFKFLHIAFMFMAVAVALGPELVLRGIGRSGDVRTIRTGYSLADRLGKAIPVLFTIGLVFGLLTAWTQGLDFFAPWLLIAYALFILATILGARVTAPHIAHVAELAAQSPDDSPSPELAAAHSEKSRIAAIRAGSRSERSRKAIVAATPCPAAKANAPSTCA